MPKHYRQYSVSPAILKEFSSQVLKKVGMQPTDADLVADSLVFADLRGTETHGVMRLGAYVKMIEARVMRAKPDLKILINKVATLLVNGDNGIGQVAARYAMKLCIERAAETGIAMVGVINGCHLSALAYWSMMALLHNMIGIPPLTAHQF